MQLLQNKINSQRFQHGISLPFETRNLLCFCNSHKGCIRGHYERKNNRHSLVIILYPLIMSAGNIWSKQIPPISYTDTSDWAVDGITNYEKDTRVKHDFYSNTPFASTKSGILSHRYCTLHQRHPAFRDLITVYWISSQKEMEIIPILNQVKET